MPDLAKAEVRPTVTLRVLVVDDDDAVHVQFRHLMKIPPPANVEIISAFSIEQAYIAIRESKPDVILLDLNLPPEWPAERTLHEIESLEKAARVPIIAFSGMEPDLMWPMAVESYGAYEFFEKSECLRPGFRGHLMHTITNAIFLHHRIQRERPVYGAKA